MKWLLISTMLSNPMTYGDKATCIEAMDALNERDIRKTAVCIPKGEDPSEQSFERFQKILNSFSQGMKSE